MSCAHLLTVLDLIPKDLNYSFKTFNSLRPALTQVNSETEGLALKTFLPERKFNDPGGCIHSQRAGTPFQAWEEAIIRVNAASHSAMLSQENILDSQTIGPNVGS